jgi:hypothetical protein
VKNCKRRCASKLRGMVSVSRVFDALIFWTVRRLKSRLASFCPFLSGQFRFVNSGFSQRFHRSNLSLISWGRNPFITTACNLCKAASTLDTRSAVLFRHCKQQMQNTLRNKRLLFQRSRLSYEKKNSEQMQPLRTITRH